MGFKQSHYDYSLFTKQVDGNTVIVLVYMDDLLVTGSNHELLCSTRQEIQNMFKMKDLGELNFFLGIEFSRSSQEMNQKLTSLQYDEHVKNEVSQDDSLLSNPTKYQRLVGRLLYLTMTRPDLSFTAQVLSQFMHYPKQSHTEAALRVLRYIKEAPGLGLLMPSEPTTQLRAYYYSDWGACLETRKSVT
ncbi:uncharacterized mitochondrial protein AtMg00810-like [Solanum dulcamara]|uniref:uncharacterized mitochondrial protein AtMg00810-like n=1 Tax=Solanum dulcamara TaxID=45834 RepID=UPI0024865435|nr:uncharacterized mitochondrial protein AtMg00810-like [Solanum dulcamara]